MSKPRPIHVLHRELQTAPDAAEPSLSYERESFLNDNIEDAEDEFHRRLQTNRRDSAGPSAGISFWRSSSDAKPSVPSFSSMQLNEKRNSSGLLGTALSAQASETISEVTERVGNSISTNGVSTKSARLERIPSLLLLESAFCILHTTQYSLCTRIVL